MWCLKEKKNPENTIYIKQGESLEIGRKGTDVILSNDGSISRLHARVEVKPAETTGPAICLLTDVGSRYGTQLILSGNNKKFIPNQPEKLKDNDIIQFGMDQYFFEVQYLPYVILTSGLNKKDKMTLSEVVEDIGATICSKWSVDCTHLTVSDAKMTQKLVTSLAAGIPIVDVSFWQAVKISREKKTALPEVKHHCPDVDDPMMRKADVNLLPLEGRKRVFSNLTFVFFLKKQLNTYHDMIKLAGGTPLYYDGGMSKSQLTAKTTILIQFNQEDSQDEEPESPSVDSLEEILGKSKRRFIPEAEISLAILHCSTKHSCNPDFRYEELLKRKGTEELERNAEILAKESQYVADENKVNKPTRIIPESIDFTTQELEEQRAILLAKKPGKSSNFVGEKEETGILVKDKLIGNISEFESLNLAGRDDVEDDKMEIPPLSCIKKKQNHAPEPMECEDLPDTVADRKTRKISKKRKSVQLEDDDDDDEFLSSTKKKSKTTAPPPVEKPPSRNLPVSSNEKKDIKMELDMEDIDGEPFIEPQKKIKKPSPVFEDKENSQDMKINPVPYSSRKNIINKPYKNGANGIWTTWKDISRPAEEIVGKRFRSSRINTEATKPVITWTSAVWK